MKKVIVIGGGPAGMFASLAAAEAGIARVRHVAMPMARETSRFIISLLLSCWIYTSFGLTHLYNIMVSLFWQ